MTNDILVETTRALPEQEGIVENVHRGAVAVVDLEGRLLYSAGNPQAISFTRSTLKPFQAVPFLRARGHEQLALSRPELALLCSSHSGETEHVAKVANLLARIGCSESDLRCGAHTPLYYAALGQTPPAAGGWTQLHNNCSGKHSGFLAWCCLKHESRADYLDLAHPLQRAIRDCVAELSGLDGNDLPCGIDGCSAPNYALPLARLAQLYARLAQGAGDAREGAVLGALFDAMTAHPELVSGQGRTDLAYMTLGRGDWVSKAGADGVQAFGSRPDRLGVAVKISDATPRALHAAFISTLSQLGLLEGRDRRLLEAWADPPIRNHRGLITGRVRATFELQRH